MPAPRGGLGRLATTRRALVHTCTSHCNQIRKHLRKSVPKCGYNPGTTMISLRFPLTTPSPPPPPKEKNSREGKPRRKPRHSLLSLVFCLPPLP